MFGCHLRKGYQLFCAKIIQYAKTSHVNHIPIQGVNEFEPREQDGIRAKILELTVKRRGLVN